MAHLSEFPRVFLIKGGEITLVDLVPDLPVPKMGPRISTEEACTVMQPPTVYLVSNKLNFQDKIFVTIHLPSSHSDNAGEHHWTQIYDKLFKFP